MELNPNESQLGQELFAQICCPTPSVFVDIGCSTPDHFSNTKPLLDIGWKGFGLDIEPFHKQWEPYEGMEFRQVDARSFEWDRTSIWLETEPFYLSVDVDENSLESLKNFFDYDMMSFPICITIEHDQYKLGKTLLTPQRELLGSLGYVLVANNLWNFEDWYVHKIHPDVNWIAEELSIYGNEENNKTEGILALKNHLRGMFPKGF